MNSKSPAASAREQAMVAAAIAAMQALIEKAPFPTPDLIVPQSVEFAQALVKELYGS